MIKFEEFDMSSFPAEECTEALKINKNFFRGKDLKTVLIYDSKDDSIIIKNLYPCIQSAKNEDEEDFFGFCNEEETEFYKPGKRYFIKAIAEHTEMAVCIGELLS